MKPPLSYKAIAWALLVVLVVVFAIDNIRESDKPSSSASSTSPSTFSTVGRIDVVAGSLLSEDRGTFIVSFVNDEPVTLTFGSSQDADVALLSDGKEVWRWSTVRAFSQVVRTVDFEPGHHMFTLTGQLTGVPPGAYTAVATVVGTPAPPPARLPVHVR